MEFDFQVIHMVLTQQDKISRHITKMLDPKLKIQQNPKDLEDIHEGNEKKIIEMENELIELLQEYFSSRPASFGMSKGGYDFKNQIDSLLERIFKRDLNEMWVVRGILLGALATAITDIEKEIEEQPKITDNINRELGFK